MLPRIGDTGPVSALAQPGEPAQATKGASDADERGRCEEACPRSGNHVVRQAPADQVDRRRRHDPLRPEGGMSWAAPIAAWADGCPKSAAKPAALAEDAALAPQTFWHWAGDRFHSRAHFVRVAALCRLKNQG